MAMICKKCGGVIPDIVIGGERSECKNHTKGGKTWEVDTG